MAMMCDGFGLFVAVLQDCRSVMVEALLAGEGGVDEPNAGERGGFGLNHLSKKLQVRAYLLNGSVHHTQDTVYSR